MNRAFSLIITSRIVTALLLGTMFAGVVGTMCLLPASAALYGTPGSGCHHRTHTPLHPQPADYRCCVSRHAPAVITYVFSPRPMLRMLSAAVHVPVSEWGGDSVPAAEALLGSPPDVRVLRI